MKVLSLVGSISMEGELRKPFETLTSSINSYAALMYSNDCTNPLSQAATFMKTCQQRDNTGVSEMETCHLKGQ